MLRLFSFFLVIIWLLISCKETAGDENSRTEKHWVSTEDQPGHQVSELEKTINGKWVQDRQECTNAAAVKTTWFFSDGEVQWNNFTHPYVIRHDTLFIAGIPHKVDVKSQNSIEITDISINCRNVLRRP